MLSLLEKLEYPIAALADSDSRRHNAGESFRKKELETPV